MPVKPKTAKASAACSNGNENESPAKICSLVIAYVVDCIETAIINVTTEKKKTIASKIFSRD